MNREDMFILFLCVVGFVFPIVNYIIKSNKKQEPTVVFATDFNSNDLKCDCFCKRDK